MHIDLINFGIIIKDERNFTNFGEPQFKRVDYKKENTSTIHHTLRMTRGSLKESALVVGATMQKQNGGLHFLQFQLYGDKAHFGRKIYNYLYYLSKCN